MWVRGLKQGKALPVNLNDFVAPYVGAWIETCAIRHIERLHYVAPYVGAWIETMRVIGKGNKERSRTLCGCVD